MAEVGRDMDGMAERRRGREVSDEVRDAARLSVARRRVVWRQRHYSASVRLLMWGLRLYVLVMVLIVAVQIARLA